MQLPMHILLCAKKNSLEASQFVAWCTQAGMPAREASNALALQIAKSYLDGQLDYVFCDRVINSIMNVVTTEEFLSASDRTVPEQVELVYLAFDAGEYVHTGDSSEGDQEEKYTRPMIRALLEKIA